MKMLIALALALACLVCVTGCDRSTPQLPTEVFEDKMYKLPIRLSLDETQAFDISDEDMQYIINILNNADWVEDLCNCSSEEIFYTQEQEIGYNPFSRVIKDHTNKRSTHITEEQCYKINAIFWIDIDLSE